MRYDQLFNSRRWTLPASIAWTAGALLVDAWSGAGRLGELLYLPPVILVACSLGRWSGVLLAAIAAAAAGLLKESAEFAAALTLFGFLTVAAVLADLWRRASRRERLSATRDALTGIANRNSFLEAAAAELNRSARTGRAFTVAYLDCDDFKSFNDSCGHPAGDALLQAIANCLKGSLRNYDVVARMGGDEFAVLLPDTSAPVGRAVVERLHRQLRECMRDAPRVVTFSIGVVTFHESPNSVDDLVRAADQAMYAVKRAGKNAVGANTAPQAVST
jgi:diguanylate cyclase (GGDEF)-like protein